MMQEQNQIIIDHQTASLLMVVFGWMGSFFSLAITAGAMIALFPPKTRMQVFGMLCCCAASFWYVGAWVIECYGYQNYSEDARLGIRFLCAVPMWMILQIIAVILTKWRDSKDPFAQIVKDIKKARGIK